MTVRGHGAMMTRRIDAHFRLRGQFRGDIGKWTLLWAEGAASKLKWAQADYSLGTRAADQRDPEPSAAARTRWRQHAASTTSGRCCRRHPASPDTQCDVAGSLGGACRGARASGRPAQLATHGRSRSPATRERGSRVRAAKWGCRTWHDHRLVQAQALRKRFLTSLVAGPTERDGRRRRSSTPKSPWRWPARRPDAYRRPAPSDAGG